MSSKTKSGESWTEKIRMVCAVLLETPQNLQIQSRFLFSDLLKHFQLFQLFEYFWTSYLRVRAGQQSSATTAGSLRGPGGGKDSCN